MQTINQVYAVEAVHINEIGVAELVHIQCVEQEDQIGELFESWYQADNELVPVVEKVWLQ
jgi:hypothetical protein